jgi:glycosyltransferase involved in cell wall biosynthesis
MPQVSIITALHNKCPYVADTIRSVLAQTMPDWELIVVENGSTDNGLEVVRQFADARIRLVVSLKCGPGAARNFGLGLATGEWILFLDADDLLAPEYLKEQATAARQQPNAHLIAGCWQEFCDDSPERRQLHHPTLYQGDASRIGDSAIAYAPWALHAAMVRRDWLGNRIRWFEPLDGWPSEDTAFWFAAIQDATLAWSESKGALYRVNTHNSRNSPKDADRWFEGLKKVVETNLATLARLGIETSTAQRASIMRTFESRYRKELRNGNEEAAERFLEEAARWLRACAWNDAPIAFRKIFGIGLIGKLTKFRRTQTGTTACFGDE